MRRLPSIKTLTTLTGNKETAKQIRDILECTDKSHLLDISPACRDWVRQCYNIPRLHELKLCAVDAILETFGVEYFEHKQWSVYYCNAGDTYSTTLLRVNGSYQIGCWGDIAER